MNFFLSIFVVFSIIQFANKIEVPSPVSLKNII